MSTHPHLLTLLLDEDYVPIASYYDEPGVHILRDRSKYMQLSPSRTASSACRVASNRIDADARLDTSGRRTISKWLLEQ